MKTLPTSLRARRVAAALLLAPVLATLAACSGTPNAGNAAGASRSGIEVFGTIDAGVSRTETKR